MTKIHQITPFLHVPSLKDAIAFFCETLPFTLKFQESDYAYLELEGAGLRILEEPGRLTPPDGKARVSVYIDVADVDVLFAQLKPKLGTLPPEHVEPVQIRPWGQKELQVRLPDGDWLVFGQPAN